MKKLLVQEFLETRSFGELAEVHGVFASFSKDGTKFSLNYDQILAKESDELAQQCRGLILRKDDGSSMLDEAVEVNGRLDFSKIIPGKTKILAYPMNRFFNYGQGVAAEINWNDPELCTFDKLDGTLCIVYYDDVKGEWCVATRSVPNADIPLEFDKFTFRSLFEQAVKDQLDLTFDVFTKFLNNSFTYCFELTSPYNRIVVSYETCQIHLLAIRDNIYGNEVCPIAMDKFIPFVPRPKVFSLKTITDVINLVNSQSPMSHEGIVVRDSKFNRIKVKNAAYVAYNKARDSLASSSRGCLELVLNEKADDVIPYMPSLIVDNIQEIKTKVGDFFLKFDNQYSCLVKQTEQIVNSFPELKGKERKVFACLIQPTKIWSAPCFEIYVGKANSLRDYINKKSKEGSWSNSFLDQILNEVGIK